MLLESATQVLRNVLNVGVYVGVGALTRMSGNSMSDRSITDLSIYAGTSTLLSIASGRISFMRHLIGPSLALDTACCSTLVTKHLARSALERLECTEALSSGVGCLEETGFAVFSQTGMLSP